MQEPIHILLVDDNTDDRELARRAVASGIPGAKFIEAGTAAEFEQCIAQEFDCVITDYQLGWSNGLAVLARVKERHPGKPVIMFTNTGSEETCAAGMKAGLSDYIVKRAEEFPKLPAAVRTALELADARRAVAERDAQVADLLERERFARMEAVRAGHLKDEFLATVSHELRTPLSAILGWAHLLQLGRLSRQQELEAFSVIEKNARTQAKLIDDILDMSRIVSGTLRIDLGPIDLLNAVRSAVDAIQPGASRKSITLTTKYDTLPPPVRGDEARIGQIVSNLLSNAIKFTPEQGSIHISLERTGSSVQIAVRDTGMGIEPAFLPHIFDRFRQSDSGPSRRHGGLGIGLSVVKSLVDMHGGSVHAYSEGAGEGACFTVSFPVAVMREHEVRAFERHIDGRHDFQKVKGLRILAVDDDADTLDIIERVLRVYGAEVTTAASADDALALLARETFDVFLSDIGMPGKDGFRMIEELRASSGPNRDIPASAVTAFARSQDRERALLAGFDGHLVKPIEPGELVAAVLSLAKRPNRRR